MFSRLSSTIQRLPQHIGTSKRCFSAAPAVLPDLSYGYGELEPSINGNIMEIHHSKHHNTYVGNFNAAMEQYASAEAKGDYAAMIALQPAIKFNGGGHVNHSIFWTNLSPNGGGEPSGELAAAINTEFGTFEDFKSEISAKSAAIQGSGWGWLAYNKGASKLQIVTCANQDPCSSTGLTPLLGIDVWEHAYYLQYQNVRPAYLKEIFNVVDWNNVAGRFADAK